MRKARTKADVEADPRVTEVYWERESGWWAYLAPGWCFDSECHTLHESTISKLCAVLNHEVERCECNVGYGC